MPRISYPTVGCTAESPVSVTRTICAAGVNVRLTIEVKSEVQVSMPGNVPNPVSFDCNRYKVQAQRAVAGVVGTVEVTDFDGAKLSLRRPALGGLYQIQMGID